MPAFFTHLCWIERRMSTTMCVSPPLARRFLLAKAQESTLRAQVGCEIDLSRLPVLEPTLLSPRQRREHGHSVSQNGPALDFFSFHTNSFAAYRLKLIALDFFLPCAQVCGLCCIAAAT